MKRITYLAIVADTETNGFAEVAVTIPGGKQVPTGHVYPSMKSAVVGIWEYNVRLNGVRIA